MSEPNRPLFVPYALYAEKEKRIAELEAKVKLHKEAEEDNAHEACGYENALIGAKQFDCDLSVNIHEKTMERIRDLIAMEAELAEAKTRIEELEALVSLAKTNWKAREATYKNSMDAIEAIAKERKERIAELENRLGPTMKFQWDAATSRIKWLEGRIVALEALLERVPHDDLHLRPDQRCGPDCPKCAYEKSK